jgi:hypothetical protein
MPYSKKRYKSRKLWNKYKRCVKKVKTKGNKFAICRKSIYNGIHK